MTQDEAFKAWWYNEGSQAPYTHHDCEEHTMRMCEIAWNKAQALAQPEHEPVAWRNAAIRVGEDLSSVGPDGYYDMTAQQWLDWAIEQEPRGKNSLAQPEQEPFCLHWEDRWGCNHYADPKEPHPVNAKPLYTTKPQRTEQEPVAWMDADGNVSDNNDHKCFPIPLYTHPPQRTEQEPMAWANLNALSEQINSVNCGTVYRLPSEAEGRQPLYTHPPQRTWVDVPDEEIKRLWIQYRAALPRYLCFAKALLARSKEKNT